MTITSGPSLGLIQNGAQGEQHYAEMLKFFRGVDGLVMLSVRSKDTAVPAADAVDGDRYLVAAGATGAWAGKAGQIARFTKPTSDPGAWEFYVPRSGWFTHVDAEKAVYRHDGVAWALWQGPAAVGWISPSGTASRALFDTATVTTPELAQRLKALIDDLRAQGRLTS